MIVYFSAEGNNRYLANRIAQDTKDCVVSILETEEITLEEEEPFGIVVPTYFWGLPKVVSEWFERVQIRAEGTHYVYLLTSFGTTTGSIGQFTATALKKKGLTLNARYAIRMPDTWTVWFDLSDVRKNKEKNAKADRELEKVIQAIKERKTNAFMPHSMPQPCGIFAQKYYESCRKTSHLKLDTDACVGCGICVGQCPAKAMELKEGKASWTKDRCSMCLGCLHKCPKFAIQYEDKTKNHGQYLHP